MRIRVAFACAAVAVVAMFGLAAAQSVKLIDSARLTAADRDAGNWLMYGRTYDDHRFSPLTSINVPLCSAVCRMSRPGRRCGTAARPAVCEQDGA